MVSTNVRAIALAVIAAAALPAWAHHSGAMFDRAKVVKLEGTIVKYDYVNPHSWITLTVPGPQGKPVMWGVEGFTPNAMKAWGLTPNTVKPGDKLVVTVHPLRDGRNGGSIVEITLADGHHVDTTLPERVGAGEKSPGR
jgi:Family of unknown function (DUF6152)